MIDTTHAVDVHLGPRSYQISIGAGVLDKAGAVVTACCSTPHAVVVTDENVEQPHAMAVAKSLQDSKVQTDLVVLPSGESTKSIEVAEQLWKKCLEVGVNRKSIIVAVGGGVIGDLAGFIAATYARGIRFLQIPTTLLAQVDSSVGGKVGINLPEAKNMVGAFWQPAAVLIDTATLDTLPTREYRAGLAEVVKYGLIDDAAFFYWLQENGELLCNGDMPARQHAVVKSCEAKAAIVAEDEKEVGRRALLNFGHTFGHALEVEAGYGDVLLHGEAVSIGMVMAFVLSARLGHCPSDKVSVVRDHLCQVGLPVSTADRPGVNWNAGALLGHMAKDKKVTDGAITFVLARGIGDAFLSSDVSQEMLVGVLEDGGAS